MTVPLYSKHFLGCVQVYPIAMTKHYTLLAGLGMRSKKKAQSRGAIELILKIKQGFWVDRWHGGVCKSRECEEEWKVAF